VYALKFVQPVLRDISQKRITGSGPAAQLPILAESAFAISGRLESIFAEKDDCRYTIAPINLQLLLHVGMIVAVEITNLNQRRNGGEVLKNRALAVTVGTPCPCQAQYRHLAREGLEQLSLGSRQADLIVDLLPGMFFSRARVTLEEVGVGLSDLVAIKQFHPLLPAKFAISYFLDTLTVNFGDTAGWKLGAVPTISTSILSAAWAVGAAASSISTES